MSVLDAKNLKATAQFRAAFSAWFEKSGLTQMQAGMKLGIAQSTVNRILSGRGAASLAQAEKIAEALGRDLIDMLAEGRAILQNKEQNAAK